MTSPALSILARCRRLGVVLAVHDDRLRYRPASAVDADLRAQLTAHKAELLRTLAAGAMPVSERIDGGDMQVVHKGPAIPVGHGDEKAGFHHGDKVRIANGVGFAAGRDNSERLEGVAAEQFTDGFNAHAGSIAQARADSQSEAADGTDSQGDAQFAYLHRDALDRRVVQAVHEGDLYPLTSRDSTAAREWNQQAAGIR